MKIYLFTVLFFFFGFSLTAQVGIGTTTPGGSLDVVSTTDGLLIPRISLSATNVATVITPTVSELVYNTATSGAGINQVTPGYYYWDGALWVRLATGNATSGWTLTGNAGTVAATNFLGTTDDIDLVFRRNNLVAGRIGTNTTSFGVGALNLSTGTNNTAIGFNAGSNLTTGSFNIMIGANTNAPSPTGSVQLNIGNTIYGTMGPTIKSVTIGGSGTPVPAATLDIRASNPTGTNTNVDGILIPRVTRERAQSMPSTTPTSTIIYVNDVATGTATGRTVNVTSVGFYFYNGITDTWIQFATGALSGWSTSGNSGLNASSNFLGTTDAVDVAFRRSNSAAGRIAATSTSFGVNALTAGSTTNATAFGVNALAANTGINNTAFGTNALAANTTSANNTAFGFNALAINTPNSDTGALNTAIGSGALANLNGGNNNTAVGFNALTLLPSRSLFNTAVGSNAMSGLNSDATRNNVAVGDNTMTGSGTITNSVAIGSNALRNATNNSTRNTAIGSSAGSATTTGNDNVFIGNAAGSSEPGAGSNKLYIENTGADASNALIYGEFDTNILRVNGTLQVNNPGGVNGYALPNVRGTVGQVLQTNGAGATSWVNSSSLSITETDPQVSSATNNRIPKWNGTTLVDGIITDDGFNAIVAGTTITTNFQMTNGATANYILQSNGAGNGSWVDPNVKSFVTTGAATGIYNVSLTEHTVRVFNGVSEVRLPNAVGNLGKIFVIIGSNGITSKVFSTAGGVIYNDVSNVLINTLNQNQRFTVQSDGADWIVIGQ